MPDISIRRLRTSNPEFDLDFDQYLRENLEDEREIQDQVSDIIRAVVERGDQAVLAYTEEFDRLKAESVAELKVNQEEMREYWLNLSAREQRMLELGKDRIRTYHEKQLAKIAQSELLQPVHSDTSGNQLSQYERPLEHVGLYIPGGTAAYPSTVLMTAVVAKVAGVEKLIATVPTPDNERNPLVFAALHLCGVDQAFTVGGAQAVAALAYGTQSIPRVDKIVGPGNAFVSEAKAQVVRNVGIDAIAGPSEILIVSDGSVDSRTVALDLLSQAEHDSRSKAILVATSETALDEVERDINQILSNLPRRRIATQALEMQSAMILVNDLSEATMIANQVAPEHLELAISEPESLLPDLRNAGAIFVGEHSGEVMGDYLAGPSHVLPTSGTARFASPLGVQDFLKRSSVIQLSRQGASELAHIAAEFADSEGLHAHALAATARTTDS